MIGCSACNETAFDPGLFADLRVAPATYVDGPLPQSDDGPAVITVDLATNRARIGQIDKPLRGSLVSDATAAIIALNDDRGYWLVPAGLPDVQTPQFPTFDVSLSFSPQMKPGPRELFLMAVDEKNHFGPLARYPLDVQDFINPEGPLGISLSWDRNADLDLHVVDPLGVEIYKRNVNSYEPPPPGQPVDPTAFQQGALLDFDSNAACVIDGRRRENIVWKNEPPVGRYLIRVDTFSLCGEPSAHWSLDVFKRSIRVTSASGQSGPADEQTPHDRGAGVLVMEFDWP